MRRALRWFSALLFLAVALPVAVVGGALVWANTEGGRARLAALAAAQVPGLSIEGLHGPLPAVAGAGRITMADADGVWLTVDGARLALDYSALLRREVRIEAVEADRIEISRPPLPAPTAEPPEPKQPSEGVLPRIPQLPVSVALDRLEVRRLELGAPLLGAPAAFAVSASARVGDGAARAALDAKRLDGEGHAVLDLRLVPAEDRLHAKITVREGPGGVLPGLLRRPEQPFELDLSLDGPASGAALDLAAALGPDATLKANGTVRSAPDGAAGADLDGTARLAAFLPPDVAPLAGDAAFSLRGDLGADRRLTLERLDLRLPAASLSASGRADLSAETLDAEVALDVRDAGRLRPLVPESVRWEAIAAKARIAGTFSEPVLDLDVTPDALGTGVPQADALLGPSPRLSLRAALPGPTVDATVNGAAADFSAKGGLGELIGLDARLSVPNLAVLGAGSEGALEVDLRAEGPRADPDITLQARSGRIEAAGRVLERLVLDAAIKRPASAPAVDARATGEIEDLPISLAVRGRPEGQALRLEEGDARLGPARLTVAGLLDTAAAAGPVFEGTLRLDASDLAPLGRLAGQAGLAGRLVLEGSLDRAANGEQGFDLRLDAPRLAYNGTDGTLRATAKGTPSDLAWTLQGRAPEGSLSGRGKVSSSGAGRRLDLESLEAQGLGETLRLASPTHIALDADGGVRLPGLAVVLGRGGRLQAAGRWGPERADLTANLTSLPLSVAGRFAPDLRPDGTLSAEVRATGPVSQPEIRATAQAMGLRVGADWGRGLPVASIRAEGKLSGESAQFRADIEAGPGGRLAATARLPRGFGPSGPLEAALDGNLNLAPLVAPFLSAGADRFSGRLAVALRAEGTVGAPVLAGRATLSDGDYRNPVYGVRVSNLNGSVIGNGTRLVVERLEGRTAGNGTIAVSGSVDVGAPGFPADLRITARDARPVVSELGTATLGADLRLTGPVAAGGLLAGEVRIQTAEIRIPSQLPASVPTLTNVREVGRPPNGRPRPKPPAPTPASAPSGPPLNLDVRVLAPSVYIRGRGAEVELHGDVTVGGTVAQPVPRGGLAVRRGTLSLLARRLDFRRGTITFAAGTLVPQFDLEARSVQGQNTISVYLRGTPTAPEVTFSSVPELPQDEILAQLLFGKATSGLSPLELAQIGAAAAQLSGVGGGGANPLDRIRSALGLDRLGVGSGSGSAASPTVEAGRYVAPGVFLGVRQGTQGGQTGVGVQVEITPRLKLEGETATGPAGDRLGFSYELEY